MTEVARTRSEPVLASAQPTNDDEADQPTRRMPPPPSIAIATGDDQDLVAGDPAPSDPAASNLATVPADFGNEPSTETGTSLADVLIRLEVAYHRARADNDRATDPSASAAPREPVTHDIRVDITDTAPAPEAAPVVARGFPPSP